MKWNLRHHSYFNPFKDWYTFHWNWKFIKTSIFTTHYTMVAVRSEEMFKFHLMLSPTYCCQRDKEKKANPLKAKSLNLSGLMKKMREFTCENPQIVCAWWGKTSSSFFIFCPLLLLFLGIKTFSCCCFKLLFPFKVQSFLCWCLLALFP